MPHAPMRGTPTASAAATASRGCPRAVDNLSLQALAAAFATGKNLVGEAAARAAVSEVAGGWETPLF
ncbi:hypothetical protein ACIQVL_50030 [Streptomyces sp. NPDC090499]|uniref:hypothetical protein n=1 Tax=Streptomyces sp. NPDC090499 TaxID=3365965 RepID=UPI003830E20E